MKEKRNFVAYIFVIMMFFLHCNHIKTMNENNFLLPTAPLLEQEIKNAKITIRLRGAGNIVLSDLCCNKLTINSINISGAGTVYIKKNHKPLDADKNCEYVYQKIELLNNQNENHNFSNNLYNNVEMSFILSGAGNIKLINSKIGYFQIKENNISGAGNISLVNVDKYEKERCSIIGSGSILINGCKVLEKNNSHNNNVTIINFTENKAPTYKNCSIGTSGELIKLLIFLGLVGIGTIVLLKMIPKRNRF